MPIHPTTMTKWRNRPGKSGSEKLLIETIKAGLKSKTIKPGSLKKVTVDTTVQEKNHRLCCFLAWNCVGAFYFLCTLFIRVVPFVKEGRATFQDMVTKQIVFWCCLDYRPCCFTVRCVCSCAARLLLHCPSIWLLLFNMYLLCIHICIYKYMHPQIHNVRFIFCWTDLVGYAFISSV